MVDGSGICPPNFFTSFYLIFIFCLKKVVDYEYVKISQIINIPLMEKTTLMSVLDRSKTWA